MNKKLLLTSMVALGFASPMAAFAVTPYCQTCETVEMNDFPADGLLEANKRYLGGAGSVFYTDFDWNNGDTLYAIADYEDRSCPVEPGYYMPKGKCELANQEACLNGYYCPAVNGSVPYSDDEDRNLYSCPTTGFVFDVTGRTVGSDQGRDDKHDCYVSCAKSDIKHASAVTGNQYWGTPKNTCRATGCDKGYHLSESKTGNISSQGLVDLWKTGAHTMEAKASWDHNTAVVPSGMAALYPFAVHDSWAVERNITTEEQYQQGNSRYLYLAGLAWCAFSGTGTNDYTSELPSISTGLDLYYSGGECWCKLIAYKRSDQPNAGNNGWQDLYSNWLFAKKASAIPGSNCAGNCAAICADLLYNAAQGSHEYENWENALLYAAGGDQYPTCQKNVINVEWSDTDEEDVIANDAGRITYSENIRTPVKAKTYRGKIFKGWKLFSTKPTE